MPEPETAPPERVTVMRPGLVRIDRIGLELGTKGRFTFDIKDDDPLSAVAEMRQVQTVARDSWRIRIETNMRMSCTHDAFLLRATMQAWEGDAEIRRRAWDSKISRDFV